MFDHRNFTATVTCFPYRTAHAANVFLTLPRQSMRQVEEMLVTRSGARNVDNHTTYCIDQSDVRGGVTYVTFSDEYVYLGHSMRNRW